MTMRPASASRLSAKAPARSSVCPPEPTLRGKSSRKGRDWLAVEGALAPSPSFRRLMQDRSAYFLATFVPGVPMAVQASFTS